MMIRNLNDKEKTMIPSLRKLFQSKRRKKSPAKPQKGEKGTAYFV
jgi:hypothetical protein